MPGTFSLCGDLFSNSKQILRTGHDFPHLLFTVDSLANGEPGSLSLVSVSGKLLPDDGWLPYTFSFPTNFPPNEESLHPATAGFSAAG